MVSLMNISFTHLALTDALATVINRIALKRYNRPLTVFTPNTEQLLQARYEPSFLATLQTADVRVPDAIGIVKADWWRAFVTGRDWQMRERVAGVDLAERIVATAAERGWRVSLMGGLDNAAQMAATNLKKRLSGLDVVSVEVGNVEITNNKSTNNKIVEEINALKPDVLLVGLGAPKQEYWVQQHKSELQTQVVMVVGGAIDIWAGKVKRAPLWVRNLGFEWLWRLAQEPWRIKRQWRLIQFAWLVLWGKWN